MNGDSILSWLGVKLGTWSREEDPHPEGWWSKGGGHRNSPKVLEETGIFWSTSRGEMLI